MESLFLGHLRVYNICIVWAPGAGGAWNQHRAAEGTSLRGGLRHRPERRGACVHGWCGQLEAGVSPPTKPHPPVGGRGTWSPAARAGSPAPSCEGSTRDLRLAGTGANEPRVPGCEQIKNVKKCPASAPGVCTLLLVISPLTR